MLTMDVLKLMLIEDENYVSPLQALPSFGQQRMRRLNHLRLCVDRHCVGVLSFVVALPRIVR